MRALDILKLRLRTLLHKSEADHELEEELKFHLDREIQRLVGTGLSRAQARRTALQTIGGVSQVQEECRDARGFRYLEDLGQDLRYATRTMRRSPAIATVAILSLALGIGANTAVFSLIDSVMLRSLPVVHPEELVRFSRVSSKSKSGNFSYPLFQQLQEADAAATEMFASSKPAETRVLVPGSQQAEQITREGVSGEYFTTLRAPAIVGATIGPEDVRMPNGNPVAVISYGWWKRRFGLDPSIVGKTLIVADTPLTVIGVARPGFFGVEVGTSTDLWMPLTSLPQKAWLVQRAFNFLAVIGRVKPGFSIPQVQARSEAWLSQMTARNIDSVRNPARRRELLDQHMAVEPAATGFSRLREQFSEPLRILLVIVGAVLLVACSNIANLQLARSSAREREIGVRLAIGAGRLRLVRQLVAESVLLSLAGGLAGVGFAYWGCEALLRFVPKGDAPLVVDLHPDARVLAFTLVVSLFSGILFGLGPALRSARTGLDTALKSESRSAGHNPRRRWFGRSLIAGQVALSMLLLVGSGLFIRTLMKLQSVNLGFDRGHVLTFDVNVLSGSLGPPPRDLMDRVVERTMSIPGVRAASYAFAGTYGSGGWTTELHAEGYTPGPDEPGDFDAALVGPHYFETMGIPILSGRGFTERDNQTAPIVAVINQSLSRHFFGNANPIGRHIHYERQGGGSDAEIVGVVRDVQHHGARKGPPAWFYTTVLQNNGPWPTFALRATGDPHALTGTLTRVLQSMLPGLVVQDAISLDDQVNLSLSRERLVATISGFFAAIALLLACIGVYGTLAYNVTRRTAEVGIRMTLGARRDEVLWMILREALGLVAGGILIGALTARAATQWIGSLLFGLEPGDLTTIALSAAAMLTVAVLAGYLPARRAASLDPMRALHYD